MKKNLKKKEVLKNNSTITKYLLKDQNLPVSMPIKNNIDKSQSGNEEVQIKNTNKAIKITIPSKENCLDNELNAIKKRKDSEGKFSPLYKKTHREIYTSNGCNIEIDQNNPLTTSTNSTQKTLREPMAISNKEFYITNETVENNAKGNYDEMVSYLNMEFDNWEDDIMDVSEDFNLDLTKPHHCKILDISHLASKVILTVISTKLNHKGLCNLEGFWIYTDLKVNNTVYITAKHIEDTWVVNNEHGLIVLEPDLLISSTALVGSLWCKRKSLLSVRFRGFDSTNQAMLTGSLVHTIFQHAIKQNVSDLAKLEDMARTCINKGPVIKALYECGISFNTLEEEVFTYLPKIKDFLKYYIDPHSNVKDLPKENWKGKIDTILDIEENIWCPELGIKGKIDVTLKTKQQVMPLELKTGKATVSLEHRGQIMLYLVMMKNLGYNVNSGLLLYLKNGILKEIPATQNEERDLVHLRNELVYYLTKAPKITENNAILPPELPEPINHPGCSNCSYQNICTAYAHITNEDITSKKYLSKIQQDTLKFLSPSHIEYFIKWTCLLIIDSDVSSSKDVKDIYLLSPKEREQNGRCITSLKISKIFEESDAVIEHSFERNDDNSFNFLSSGIVEKNYVIVSTDKQYAVAAGLVSNISSNSVSVTLDRNLKNKFKNQNFSIDSYDSSMIQSFQFSSLALLLENTCKGENLRKIIIDKAPPTFKKTLPKIIGTKGKSILKRLNIVQQRAVLKAITSNEFFLIKGMPGTGKTATIVALIQLLYELGKTVLITSHTNSAVDNVCLKLLEYGVKFLRLGSESKIHTDLLKSSEHYLTKNCTTPNEYEYILHSAQILAVTCYSSGHPVLTKRSLDFCIVDESTQVLQTSVIRPLYACKTFILIGDPDQLPAVVRNSKARDLGMSESLFERLYKPEATIALNINYRMNKSITSFANHLTYNGELKIGNKEIENATICVNPKNLKDIYKSDSWVFKVLDNSLENAVQFLDTGPVWNLPQEVQWKINKNYNGEKSSNANIHEAAVIFKIIKALLRTDIQSKNIGVIASYRHQVEQLSSILEEYSIDINTVDQFQGKDKSIIIYSCGNSRDPSVFETPGKHDILEDKRRINVAITRAKHKLIIIGDIRTLLVYSTFKKLLSFCKNNIIKLSECKDFIWENILDLNSF